MKIVLIWNLLDPTSYWLHLQVATATMWNEDFQLIWSSIIGPLSFLFFFCWKKEKRKKEGPMSLSFDWRLKIYIVVSLYSLNSMKGKRCNAPLTKHESSSMKGALHLLHENEFLHSMSSPKKKKKKRRKIR